MRTYNEADRIEAIAALDRAYTALADVLDIAADNSDSESQTDATQAQAHIENISRRLA